MSEYCATIYLNWGCKKYFNGLSLAAVKAIFDNYNKDDEKVFKIDYNGVPVFTADRSNIICIDFETNS